MHSMNSSLHISQADARPMYLQIMEQIRARIASGDWAAGRELPSIRALAGAINVSVITVKRAYLELEQEGVIVTRQGKGSFVAESGDGSAARELQLQKLDEHLRGAAEIARQLDLSSEDLLRRLRGAYVPVKPR
jgi:GntR family transcriptional regulator